MKTSVHPLDTRLIDLYRYNDPGSFWKFCDPIESSVIDDAAIRSASLLGDSIATASIGSAQEIVSAVLSEASSGGYRFTERHRLYYRVLRPLLPPNGRRLIRHLRQRPARETGVLGWPIEPRFVRYQLAVARDLLQTAQSSEIRFLGIWPHPHASCLVLTHDVESGAGVACVPRVADIEEELGFRSSFNFVPDAYPVPASLLDDLRARGFEIGVHGLKHDGLLFSDRSRFKVRARKINSYLSAWGARGFRAPMTHRHPVWMQDLDIDYDLSFFDTDPYEPMPGGVMTIWPFFVGRFVALPTTLMQDHTLSEVFKEPSCEPWLEKAAFIHRHHGLALMNTHPDYLSRSSSLRIYRDFLRKVGELAQWHALPAEVAAWWRQRLDTRPGAPTAPLDLPQDCVWRMGAADGQINVIPSS